MVSKIELRLINENDTPNIIRWRNSHEVKRYLYTQTELTPEIHHHWLETQVYTRKCYQFIIEVHDDTEMVKPIGTVYIKNIDYVNSKGEYGVYIGETDERGKGYANIIIERMLNFAFFDLKLNRIYLTAFYDNKPSIKAAINVGFELEAIFRDEILRGNEYTDIVFMGISKAKWESMNTKEINHE